jgi:hypothetical protein
VTWHQFEDTLFPCIFGAAVLLFRRRLGKFYARHHSRWRPPSWDRSEPDRRDDPGYGAAVATWAGVAFILVGLWSLLFAAR